MSVPDNELIAEVLLTSEGFAAAAPLARKLVSLFDLSRELLSPQQHYDWGLRALKTCLGIAGEGVVRVGEGAGLSDCPPSTSVGSCSVLVTSGSKEAQQRLH
jgi:dynein heavy chain 2